MLVFCSIVVLSACTNVKKMSDESRSELKSICMFESEEIIYPEKAFFMSHGQGWAMGIGAGLGGAIGGVIVGAASGGQKTETELITEFLNSEPNTFSSELVDIFSSKIESNTSFDLSCNDGFGAKMSLNVKQYGIAYVPFTKSYRPLLTLYAEIVDRVGTVLWKNQIALTSHSTIVDKRRRDEWFNKEESSKIMKQKFSKLAESILERFTLHLSGDYSYMAE